MKLNIQAASIFVLATALSGCVTMEQKAASFDDSHSQAFNIARAGGLVTGISDKEIPKDANTGAAESGIYNTASAAIAYANPTIGLSSAQSLSVSLLEIAIAPDSHGARSSVVAWMPISQAASAEAAQSKLIDILSKSISESLSKQELKFSKTRKKAEGTSFFIEDQSVKCQSIDKGSAKACAIHLNVYKPSKVKTPEFINNGESESWAFTSSHGFFYNAMKMDVSKMSSINTLEIIKTSSSSLPEWVYIYSSPKDTYIDSSKNQNNKYPMILSKGKELYFVK